MKQHFKDTWGGKRAKDLTSRQSQPTRQLRTRTTPRTVGPPEFWAPRLSQTAGRHGGHAPCAHLLCSCACSRLPSHVTHKTQVHRQIYQESQDCKSRTLSQMRAPLWTAGSWWCLMSGKARSLPTCLLLCSLSLQPILCTPVSGIPKTQD